MAGEMKYGSVCSGIEAATAAWHGLGWQPSFFSEIEPFPRAVLTHHYPHVPLHGDFTTIKGDQYESIQLLVGGTPCQSFSVAGLRNGLDDGRGNLALEFLRLAYRTRPRWLVWENVPGVLSSNGGRDFGSIIGGMVQLGYGVAYRILDAQFFGVAQRRRRVFVVGYLGDWRRAAAVLFERHSLQGHSAPRREAGESVAGTLGGSSQSGGFRTTDLDNNGAFRTTDLDNNGAFIPVTGKTQLSFGHAANPLDENLISFTDKVRRLSPRECERMQGFPDDYTLVPHRGKPAADGPRYKALGNSMAVPVMRWIGRRIAKMEALS